MLEEYAQDNNDTSYISAAYFAANVVLIMVWGHTLQCMFEEYEMHVLTYMLSVLQRHNLVIRVDRRMNRHTNWWMV